MAVGLLRAGLILFVLVWIFGPSWVRAAVPVWLVFLVALGLEVQFFLGARRPDASEPDRTPQAVDLERFGYDTDDAPERRRPLPLRRALTGLGVVGAVALLLWLVESRTGWEGLDAETRAEAQERFSAEASRIAAKPVTVRCDEAGRVVGAVQHADGAAVVGGDLAFLTPERCLDLYRLAFDGELRAGRTGRALAVLAHEAWHLRGVRDEGTTECYALQSGVGLGRRLGLSRTTARQLMRQQLVENELRRSGSPEYLVPPECRDGGELDLDPASPSFP